MCVCEEEIELGIFTVLEFLLQTFTLCRMGWFSWIYTILSYWFLTPARQCHDFSSVKGKMSSVKLNARGDLEFQLVCDVTRNVDYFVMSQFGSCPSDSSSLWLKRLNRWIEGQCDTSRNYELNDLAGAYLAGDGRNAIVFRADAHIYSTKAGVHNSLLYRDLTSIEPQEELFVLIYEEENLYVFQNIHSLLEKIEAYLDLNEYYPTNIGDLVKESIEVSLVSLATKDVSFRISGDHFMVVRVRDASEDTRDACSICLVDIRLVRTAEVAPLTCGHWFHKECISEWFKKQQTCPLCVQESFMSELVLL